jgi:hypothetical protein
MVMLYHHSPWCIAVRASRRPEHAETLSEAWLAKRETGNNTRDVLAVLLMLLCVTVSQCTTLTCARFERSVATERKLHMFPVPSRVSGEYHGSAFTPDG